MSPLGIRVGAIRSKLIAHLVEGKAFIQGGYKHLRNALYMPAVVAARHNPDKRRFYERLIKAGKTAIVTFTDIMPKLILLANFLKNKIESGFKSKLD